MIMLGRETIKKKKVITAVSLMTGILIAVFLFFTMTTANAAMSEPNHSRIVTLQGAVVGIDPISKTLTVTSPETGGQKFVTLDEKTKVLACNETKSFEDINIGDEVTVTYHKLESGKVVVDNVALLSSPGIYALLGMYTNKC